jgi:hypothetical protein
MHTKLRQMYLHSILGAAFLAFALATAPAVSQTQEEAGIARFLGPEEPPVFDDAQSAIDAFKTALAADDVDAVAKLLGLNAERLKADKDTMDAFAMIREGAARKVVIDDLGDRKILEIGNVLWPLPFPVVKGDQGKWAFDTFSGLAEIINRRVGENELQTISTMGDYVSAQRDYASEDRDGDGVLEYAQLLVSSDGETNGLYWPPDQGDGQSPAGSFIEEAALGKAKAGKGYFGYRYRILTGQGDNIAGGAYDYVINGNMIAGFGLIAWPVKYAETGVKTFVVNQQGIVYEKDLGPATEAIVGYIDRFNPDDSWDVSED